MNSLNSVSNIKFAHIPQFKGKHDTPAISLPEIEPDKFESSTTKKQKKKDFTEITTALFISAGVAAAGIFGGKYLYNKHFQKLACGVKKGEINDALYNFIKNNDKKGELFNDKETLLEINERLDDEKLLILKQLAKMKQTSFYSNSTSPRFTLSNIKDLLSETTEFNIKYLEQLANKSEKGYGEELIAFSAEDIHSVLQYINSKNEKVASQLIDMTDVKGYNHLDKLKTCLKKINKDNIDVWQLILSHRKSGPQKLELDELPKLAKTIEETKNPKCAEILLNAKKKNGSGLYIHNTEEVISLLKVLKEENAENYKKFYEIRDVKNISSKHFETIITKVNENNIDQVELILTKKAKSYIRDNKTEEALFNNYDRIQKILENINKENSDILTQLIDISNKKELLKTSNTYSSSTKRFKYPDEIISDLMEDFYKNPDNLENAKQILNSGIVDGKQTMDLEQFVKKYFNIH